MVGTALSWMLTQLHPPSLGPVWFHWNQFWLSSPPITGLVLDPVPTSLLLGGTACPCCPAARSRPPSASSRCRASLPPLFPQQWCHLRACRESRAPRRWASAQPGVQHKKEMKSRRGGGLVTLAPSPWQRPPSCPCPRRRCINTPPYLYGPSRHKSNPAPYIRGSVLSWLLRKGLRLNILTYLSSC